MVTQRLIISKYVKNKIFSLILKILFVIFLIINAKFAIDDFFSCLDDLTGPLAPQEAIIRMTAAIPDLSFESVLLTSLLLLMGGRFFPCLRLKRRDFWFILFGTVLGLIIGSLVVFTGPGCCMISYTLELGFPIPFLSLGIAADSSPALSIDSLHSWPFIYQQVFAYIQQNKVAHPDVIYWDWSSISPNIIFYTCLSIILLFVIRALNRGYSAISAKRSRTRAKPTQV